MTRPKKSEYEVPPYARRLRPEAYRVMEMGLLKSEDAGMSAVLKDWQLAFAKMKRKIHGAKRRVGVKSDNQQYRTGYMCALSLVEGIIAEIECEMEGNDGDKNQA